MDEADQSAILVINTGSSSIKFALYSNAISPRTLIRGNIDRMGEPSACLIWETDQLKSQTSNCPVPDYPTASREILRLCQNQFAQMKIRGIGHRIVHGGPHHSVPERVTTKLLNDLDQLSDFVPNHLPAELATIRAFQQAQPNVPQVVCFDTAFHHDLPPVARQLPVPRELDELGVRRYGFHGLSYTYLLNEFSRQAGEQAADGRLIFAHLGSGASLAAVHHRRCIDTSMGFTPTGGLVMGTRTGDLDPGLLAYLLRTHRVRLSDLETFLNKQSGLLGISQTSADVRDLLQRQTTDPRCALALEIFCYQARKWIGSFAAALGGLDGLIFSAGIGEHAPEIRQRICQELEFLGIELDADRNQLNSPVISSDTSRVVVRVIPTNEQLTIAQAVFQLLRPEFEAVENVV